MNLYKRIIEIIDANLIHCLIPIILTLIVIELLFKKRFATKKVLHLICWIIILYSIITWTYSLAGMIFYPEEFAFIERATGSYSWAYWTMFLSGLILPFALFIKKISSNFYYVLFVAIFMKIGFYFERFVIMVTIFHREYGTERENTEFTESLPFAILMLFIQGIIIAIILLSIFEIIKKKRIKGQSFLNDL
ncbi:hypothetical protein EV143_1055 [Flavobacterium chryseum]|uniref:hypothetical protein n=1 Tax=Flavobacterium sp. P3160 TaxID=2512113 RepID=UPI00105FE771|nr:hypothetical protein [Flavobacterium sp. P3160]TDO73415.1 hypothetical protein EV143_1055 [Flavobacterium sp. P3160]